VCFGLAKFNYAIFQYNFFSKNVIFVTYHNQTTSSKLASKNKWWDIFLKFKVSLIKQVVLAKIKV